MSALIDKLPAGLSARFDQAGSASRAASSTAPLHVVMVAPPYFTVPPAAYGGVESVVAILADTLVDQGHEVTLLGAGESRTKATFVRVWDEPVPHRLGDTWPELMNAVVTANAVRKLTESGRVDVVHDHTYAGAVNAPYFASLGVPTVTTMHGPGDDPDLASYYRAAGDGVSLVAISDRQAALAPDLNWIGTVPNALRLADWEFRAEKQNYALFLGRFSADKGAHLALDAAHAAGVPMVLAGKCSEPAEKEYFTREIAPRMRKHDVMVGVAEAAERQELLANAQCLLFPVQWEEPFGMVMIEAMACGTPVVALRHGAVPEVVVSGVTGIVCDEPAELIEALAAVRDIEPHACRAHVAAHFDAPLLARRYTGMYRTAMAQSSIAAPRGTRTR